MPLNCLDGLRRLYSYRYSPSEWDEIAGANRIARTLRMACCGSAVVLKRSKYGTQFFAHAKKGECSSAPESHEHLRAKEIIAKAVELAGWSACVEHRDPENQWVVDVLALREGCQIAFEVQLSAQPPEETLRRYNRYQAGGVSSVWLLKAPSHVTVGCEKRRGNEVVAPLFHLAVRGNAMLVFRSGDTSQNLSAFVASVLSGQQRLDLNGVVLSVNRHTEDRQSLKTVEKVKSVIAQAADSMAWAAEIRSGYVVVSYEEVTVTFHVGEKIYSHPKNARNRIVTMSLNSSLKRVIANDLDYLRNADQLESFVKSMLRALQ